MTTGNSYRARNNPHRRAPVDFPSSAALIGAAIAYVIGVSVVALIPALSGFADRPIWQLALCLTGVWVAAVTIDHVVEGLIGALVARTARDQERSKYTIVDAISGAVLLAVLTLGLSLVFENGTAFVAGLITAVLSGILPSLLHRPTRRRAPQATTSRAPDSV